jgi:tRNA threonylcarbamoyladenosine biosynthesis protein TsaE
MTERVMLTHSAEETIARGRELGGELHAPVLLLLSGDLGAGKTTLAKGIISGLGAASEEEVTSPTYTLVHLFHNHTRVYHVDLYRINGFADLETLGLEDVLSENAVVIVEWPEKLTLRTDCPVVEARLDHAGKDIRRIAVHDPSGALTVAVSPLNAGELSKGNDGR